MYNYEVKYILQLTKGLELGVLVHETPTWLDPMDNAQLEALRETIRENCGFAGQDIPVDLRVTLTTINGIKVSPSPNNGEPVA